VSATICFRNRSGFVVILIDIHIVIVSRTVLLGSPSDLLDHLQVAGFYRLSAQTDHLDDEPPVVALTNRILDEV
jgi:hypothetical protein